MKNTFTNIMLFIIMLLLIGAVIVFGMAIYANVTSVNVSETYTINTILSTVTDDEEKNQTKNNSETNNNYIEVDEIRPNINNTKGEKYYYEQLTENQKKIYDGLQKNKENMTNGTYKVQYGGIFTDILNKEGGNEKLGQDYQSAVETFLYDNPDVFYLDANKLFLSVETTSTILKKTYNVYVGPAENSTYYVEGFKSELQVRQARKKIEDVKDRVVKNLSGDTYRDILKIHDYLVATIDYDEEYSSIGAYSVYGALIDGKCVCEGYAKALKYLLDAANIPCVIAQGTAKNSAGKIENHAWNTVYLNDKWYYIDTTWDDPIIVGEGNVAKSVQYKYFLKGTKTFDKDHTLVYHFSEGGRIYRYPVVQEYDYK